MKNVRCVCHYTALRFQAIKICMLINLICDVVVCTLHKKHCVRSKRAYVPSSICTFKICFSQTCWVILEHIHRPPSWKGREREEMKLSERENGKTSQLSIIRLRNLTSSLFCLLTEVNDNKQDMVGVKSLGLRVSS